jgi:topoisomerase IV subunit A
MNVLDADQTPRVMSLREVLQAWLDHRMDVLVRRSNHRLGQIAHRLEVLQGYMIVFLNLDEVIAIIREEDDPRAVMMARWGLNENQADAILNMRLRSLRRLEEIAIRKEIDGLETEQSGLQALLADENLRVRRLSEEVAELKKRFGGKTALGARRTVIGAAPADVVVPLEAMIDREPVTIVCSAKGWIRALKGHNIDAAELKYKEGDAASFIVPAETTDKLLVFATNGRFYTLGADRLPGGRGHGEPLRLMIDLPNDAELLTIFVHKPGRKLLVAAADGRGFIVPEGEVLAQTRTGKQVLNVRGDVEAAVCRFVDGDHVAVVGANRKLLVFPLEELPEMTRGRGNKLQSYTKGELSDVTTFTLAEGLPAQTGDRTRTFSASELTDWIGKRAQAGRVVPAGFPRSNKFG